MLELLNSIMFIGLILAFGSTVYYSVKYRKERTANLKGLFQAKQNISMGFLLILLAIFPLLGTLGSVGIVVGTLFLLLGVFNLFAGIRNRTIYQARLK